MRSSRCLGTATTAEAPQPARARTHFFYFSYAKGKGEEGRREGGKDSRGGGVSPKKQAPAASAQPSNKQCGRLAGSWAGRVPPPAQSLPHSKKGCLGPPPPYTFPLSLLPYKSPTQILPYNFCTLTLTRFDTACGQYYPLRCASPQHQFPSTMHITPSLLVRS